MESGGRAKNSGGELSLVGIHLVQDIHVLRRIRPARTGGHSGCPLSGAKSSAADSGCQEAHAPLFSAISGAIYPLRRCHQMPGKTAVPLPWRFLKRIFVRLKLDEKTVAALDLGAKSEEIAWDTALPRFGLRLQRRHSDGKVLKRFIVQYRVPGGRKPRLTIGPAETLGGDQ